MKTWCKEAGLPDYSERLTYNKNHSLFYRFKAVWLFKTCRHSWSLFYRWWSQLSGVYCDTKNIVDHKKEDAIIIWHDFKNGNRYNVDVVKAVSDVLGKEFEMCMWQIIICAEFIFLNAENLNSPYTEDVMRKTQYYIHMM